MTTIIEAEGLSKWFGEIVAVNNLNLSVDSRITGLLGPNGAGKSTLIKLALGLYVPSRGVIRVLGQKPRNNTALLQRVGYCPETDHFFENTTGFEFVYWLNRYWGMGRSPARKLAEAACELTRMTDRMHDPIDTYSKGMRQRIKIAQSLTTAPDLLFLDEPMNGLDPKGRDEMYLLIQTLADSGISVVVSSHILYEIERITDSVVLMYRGALLAQGRVRDIRDLIDRHPHAIRIETKDPRSVSKAFLDIPQVSKIEFEEDALVVRTREPNQCYAVLNEMARTGSAPIEGITCSDDNLQSVFEYLTR